MAERKNHYSNQQGDEQKKSTDKNVGNGEEMLDSAGLLRQKEGAGMEEAVPPELVTIKERDGRITIKVGTTEKDGFETMENPLRRRQSLRPLPKQGQENHGGGAGDSLAGDKDTDISTDAMIIPAQKEAENENPVPPTASPVPEKKDEKEQCKEERRSRNSPYGMMLCIYGLFIVFAFVVDTPKEIWEGTIKIVTSRGVLLTDFMAVGGVGATLINAAVIGSFSIIIHMLTKVRPNGATLMAIWLSTGFAMFGKNIINMIPITFGVWLYSQVKKEPFRNFTLASLLSATLTPVVGGIAFHEMIPRHVSIPLGLVMGTLAGFIFPAVSQFTVRIHSGYNLYNMGFAGGLIATFVVSGFEAVGISMENELHWSSGLNFELAFLLYIIFLGLILYGLFASGEFKMPPYKSIMENGGRLVTDYLVMYGYGAYFNMGLLGAFATTLMLIFGADLNGATICGIFTIVGFAAFGKHLRNVTPLFIGAIICTFVNEIDPRAPVNLLAILFSTALSPIAGQFGMVWGVIAGFLHVNMITHIGFLNSGLNLYNNGYAAGFVAALLVPIIGAFHKSDKKLSP